MRQTFYARISLRLAAIIVAVFALAQLGVALVLAGPHSDVPGQPVSNALLIVLSLGLFRVAISLWRTARESAERRALDGLVGDRDA